MKIQIDIESCKQCSFFKITDTHSDGFDFGEDWYCTKVKKDIAGYVEWRDKIEVPKWCPIKVK